jgi:hypothetical protein
MRKGFVAFERLAANSCASALPPGSFTPIKHEIVLNPVCKGRFLNNEAKNGS